MNWVFQGCSKCLPNNCEIHCVAIDVKKLADSVLGENSDNFKTFEYEDGNDIPKLFPNKHDKLIISDSCVDKTGTEKVESLVNEEENTTNDEQVDLPAKDITIAMAYDIQNNNPFAVITHHFHTLKQILSFGKTADAIKKKEIVLSEEIPKTPLPKSRRKPFTKKFRQRHCLTPSLQSRIRRILATYKCQHQDGCEDDMEKFHMAEIGNVYQKLTSTETEIYSIEESREVFNFNAFCSKSMESLNSSNLEYEIGSNISTLNDQNKIYEEYNCFIEAQQVVKDFDNLSSEAMHSSRSHQSIKTFLDLNQFLLTLNQACKLFDEPLLETNTELDLIKIMKENMENCTIFQNALSFMSQNGLAVFDPYITNSNYDKFKDILYFIKMVRKICSKLHIPVMRNFNFNFLFIIFFQILKKIENQIADKILQYQSENTDNDYCCVVYYPVLR